MGVILSMVAVCAIVGLMPRLRAERADRSVAIIADFREVLPLARMAGMSVSEALALLKERGLRGLMVSELTGEDAMHGVGPATIMSSRGGEDDGTIVSILPDAPCAPLLSRLLRLRLVASDDARWAGIVRVPLPLSMMKTVGIVPDVEGLEAAKDAGLAVFYRPAPSPGPLARNAADALRCVIDEWSVATFASSGEVVAGYPDVGPMADVSREKGVPVAMVEFSRQLGAPMLNALAAPSLLPLHSVTNEELMVRDITRQALRERLIRAAVERSVRLLVLRAAPQNMGSSTLVAYAEEIADLARGLEDRGFTLAWPSPSFADMGASSMSRVLAAWALAAMLMLTGWCLAVRMMPCPEEAVALRSVVACVVASVALGAIMLASPALARVVGALAAPLIVTEASLAAMDIATGRAFWRRLGASLLVALVGGLALAAFFSVPAYMLRLRTFSGVKLTLMLPPVLVLLHDLKRRIHPEPLMGVLSRPPSWGELALCGALLIALGLVLFRSGNVAFIPGFEAKIRAALEHQLVARPRSREVFVGYPSLLLLGFLVGRGLWARYREVLRIGVVLGFASVVNSFCHFHTPLALILLREFNGLWTGLSIGVVLVALVRWALPPLSRALRPLAE